MKCRRCGGPVPPAKEVCDSCSQWNQTILDLVATVTGLKADELEIDNGSFNKKEDLEARTGIAAQNGGLDL